MDIVLIVLSIFFCLAVIIKPEKIKGIPLNIFTGSALVISLLSLLQVIDLETIRLGVIGGGQIEPWKIIMIFFTLAYTSISLDETGILNYISYKIVHRSKNNGLKLFIFFYLLAGFLTIFTSNDVVILTLTPIIFYLGKHGKINIIPILFAQFFGANTFSMLLYIGNKTNIIIGNAVNLGFLEYTKVMWFPTLIAATANLLLLYLFFRKKISKKIEINKESFAFVENWSEAILKSSLMILGLLFLIFSEKIGMPIWLITSYLALAFIILDLLIYLYKKNKNNSNSLKNKAVISFIKMPWSILPFVLTFFILIAKINSYGIIDYLVINSSHVFNSLEKGIFINGIIGFFMANIINNQPMSILFSNILINENIEMSKEVFQASVYSIIIASNLGANLSMIGALAGLMWKKILKNKGLDINYFQFLKVGIIITPIVFALSLLSLLFVMKNFH
jgi:arsenical pump membrane protein